MQPFFFAKFKRRVKQALHIKKYNGPYEKQMLKRKIKQKISVRLVIVPTAKAYHPRGDVKNTQEQKYTKPFVSVTFVFDASAV